MSVKIEQGSFWEYTHGDRGRFRVCGFDVDGDPVLEDDSGNCSTSYASTVLNHYTLIPGCDSFDWVKPADPPAAPAKVDTHRILEVGEVIEEGDEARSKTECDSDWYNTICAGMQVESRDLNYYRRKLPTCLICLEYPEAVYDDMSRTGDNLPDTDAVADKLTLVGTVPGGRMFFLPDFE